LEIVTKTGDYLIELIRSLEVVSSCSYAEVCLILVSAALHTVGSRDTIMSSYGYRFHYLWVVIVALLGISSMSKNVIVSAAEKPASHLVVLTDKTFSDVFLSNHFWFIDFYAPWCGHCKTMEVSFITDLPEECTYTESRALRIQINYQ
jgi:thiol:disulfide interchange protein